MTNALPQHLLKRDGSVRDFDAEKIVRAVTRAGRATKEFDEAVAREIVERFHSCADADAAEAEFSARFQKGAVPNDIPEVAVAAQGGDIGVMQMIRAAGLAPSNAEAGRNIDQGGVRINGETVRDRALRIPAGGEPLVLQVGKRRWARVTVTAGE